MNTNMHAGNNCVHVCVCVCVCLHVCLLVGTKLVVVVSLEVYTDVGHSQNRLINVHHTMNQTSLSLHACVHVRVHACMYVDGNRLLV